ncbi:MAG TPA: hypothetical protein PLO67_14635 [Saprospiraceae bacterium]|nr:hypothetical protein [Saprospiraceae bacterium]HPI07177.1 hypothetical protein [Saprospiraceae bacterium]
MKKWTLLPLLLLPLLVHAQTRASVDVLFSPDYSWLKTLETIQIAGRFGINVNVKLTERLHLKTGMRLARAGYTTGKSGLRYESEYATGTWVPDPSLPHRAEFIHHYLLLEWPVMGRLEWNRRKWSPFMEIGMSPVLFLSGRTTQITDFETKTIKENLVGVSTFQLAGNLAFGYNYQVNQKIQVFGQPTFRYLLTKLKKAQAGHHLYSIGLEMGCRLRIK